VDGIRELSGAAHPPAPAPITDDIIIFIAHLKSALPMERKIFEEMLRSPKAIQNFGKFGGVDLSNQYP
jgi:hypothetical protein